MQIEIFCNLQFCTVTYRQMCNQNVASNNSTVTTVVEKFGLVLGHLICYPTGISIRILFSYYPFWAIYSSTIYYNRSVQSCTHCGNVSRIFCGQMFCTIIIIVQELAAPIDIYDPYRVNCYQNIHFVKVMKNSEGYYINDCKYPIIAVVGYMYEIIHRFFKGIHNNSYCCWSSHVFVCFVIVVRVAIVIIITMSGLILVGRFQQSL